MEVQGYQKTPKMIPYGTPRPPRPQPKTLPKPVNIPIKVPFDYNNDDNGDDNDDEIAATTTKRAGGVNAKR